MANRADSLIAWMFGNRWRATHAPAAAATLVLASPQPQSSTERVHLETMFYSIANKNAGNDFTVTVSIRNASAAGTVLASLDELVLASQTAKVSMSAMAFPGKDGQALAITMDTVLASVKATCNIAGWIESKNG